MIYNRSLLSRVVRLLSRPRPGHIIISRSRPTNFISIRTCSSEEVHIKIAELTVNPPAAFIDEQLSVCVYGLGKLSKNVTIRAFVDERGRKFESYAHFVPDANGAVEVVSHPSIRGSYTGVMPMGLFTHMKPSPRQRLGIRLVKKDVTTPLVFYLTVYDGCLTTEDFYSKTTSHTILAKTTVERWYMSKDVDRIEIKSGNIRGTLFKPKGNGPFPGIIDIFGSGGGIMEYRAALFASHGFACFSLAYFRYDDLTEDPSTVGMEYFEEAVDWLLSNPFVMDSGIGVIGISTGGQIVLKLSTICGPKIKAAICINGNTFNTPREPSRLYKGKISPTMKVCAENVVYMDDGLVDLSRYFAYKREDIDWSTMMNLEDSSSQFLFIVGEDDKSWCTQLYSMLACEYLDRHGKDNWELLSYPRAGHLIEPAYSPLCDECFMALFFGIILYGGHPDEHAIAQEDSWRKTLAFFKKHVGTSDPVRSLPSLDSLSAMTIQSKLY